VKLGGSRDSLRANICAEDNVSLKLGILITHVTKSCYVYVGVGLDF